MPLEPVLDIFMICISRRKKKKDTSFRELLKLKLNATDISDTELFNLFINRFVRELDIDECYKIEGSKKVLTIKPQSKDGDKILFDPMFKPEPTKFLFSGIIHGGKFGEKTHMIPVGDKNEQKEVPANIALTKEFFFLIHLPMDGSKGILMVQSYAGISYKDHLEDYLNKKILSNENYCITKYHSIYLNSIKDLVKNSSHTKALTYFRKSELSEYSGDNKENIILGKFKLSISLQPLKDEICNFDDYDNAFKELTKNEKSENWDKKVTIQDLLGKDRKYFLDNEDSLRPRISLRDEIDVKDDGSFDVNLLYLYCMKIMPEALHITNK